ncbi:MAG: DNA polymerase III subunit delta [Nitrospinota bacterium]
MNPTVTTDKFYKEFLASDSQKLLNISIFCIYGDNLSRISKIGLDLKNRVVDKDSVQSYHRIPKLAPLNSQGSSEDMTDLYSLIARLKNISMFGDKSVAYVGPLAKISDADVDLFIDYFQNPNSESILILSLLLSKKEEATLAKKGFFDHISKDGLKINAHILSSRSEIKLAKDELKKRGTRIDDDALEHLMKFCMNDSLRLQNELDKLSGYADTDHIKLSDVNELTGQHSYAKLFDLIGAVRRKDRRAAIVAFDNLVNQNMALQIVTKSLTSELLLILAVLSGKSRRLSIDQIASQLKIQKFIISDIYRSKVQWSKDELYLGLQRLYKLTEDSMKSTINIRALFVKTLSQLASKI